MVIKYSGFPEPPVMSCLTVGMSGIYIFICNLYSIQTRYVFPPFIPNDYFFDKFKDKGEEKSHIYAWGVREVMSKYSGLPKDDFIDLEKKE
jgi:hypothetical protein